MGDPFKSMRKVGVGKFWKFLFVINWRLLILKKNV